MSAQGEPELRANTRVRGTGGKRGGEVRECMTSSSFCSGSSLWSAVITEGPVWKSHRKIVTPSFSEVSLIFPCR